MPTDDDSEIEEHTIQDENVIGAIAQFLNIKEIEIEEIN